MSQTRPLIAENRFDVLFAAVLAICLLALLFPIARPRMVSNQPWRAELATSIVLAIGIVGIFIANRRSAWSLLPDAKLAKRIVALFTAFTLWGLLSAFWAGSVFSVWHHTLVWCEFILFFLLTLKKLEHSGIGFVVTVFLWLTGIIATLCLIDYVTLPDFKSLEGTLRARYSSYAELLITAFPLLFGATLYCRKKSSSYLIAVIAFAGWMVVMLSLSKGAFIAGTIGFGCFFALSLIFSSARFRKKTLSLAAAWLVVTIVFQAGFSMLTNVPATADYISGKADATRETSMARVFVWQVGLEMARGNWLIGVGADNFGRSFNDARSAFRVHSPDHPRDEVVGNHIVERAHNELLQITAELGIVGLILICCPFVLLAGASIKLLLQRRRFSPLLCASLAGMAAFIVSSMVSSFSLRIVQNGIVFFIVFSVAVWSLTKRSDRTARFRSSYAELSVASLVALALLMTFSLKGLAEFYVGKGVKNPLDDDAITQFRTAAKLDPDYAATSMMIADRKVKNKDHKAAANELRKAIDGGLGVIGSYTALAECEEKAGNIESADETYRAGLNIFPRSVFLRVRYAKFLNDTKKIVESDEQLSIAKNNDSRQAAGWFNLLNKGSVAAFYEANSDPQIALPEELEPAAIVLRYLDKPPDDCEDK